MSYSLKINPDGGRPDPLTLQKKRDKGDKKAKSRREITFYAHICANFYCQSRRRFIGCVLPRTDSSFQPKLLVSKHEDRLEISSPPNNTHLLGAEKKLGGGEPNTSN